VSSISAASIVRLAAGNVLSRETLPMVRYRVERLIETDSQSLGLDDDLLNLLAEQLSALLLAYSY
jgi:predicted RND superfamily exporter protein